MFFARSPSITPECAATRLTRGELVLVDVRQPAELRAGRVRDAVNIPLTQLPGRLDELDSDRQWPVPLGAAQLACDSDRYQGGPWRGQRSRRGEVLDRRRPAVDTLEGTTRDG
jgi:rhodanese-related sulfurtransferase